LPAKKKSPDSNEELAKAVEVRLREAGVTEAMEVYERTETLAILSGFQPTLTPMETTNSTSASS
jgi:hypothetical protein